MWLQYLVRRSCRMVFTCTRALSSSTNLNNSTVLFWWGWFTTKRYTVSSKKKKETETAEFQQFFATVCWALSALSSLQHRARVAFGALPSWLFRGQRTSTKAMQDTTAPGSRPPATLLLGSLYRGLMYKLCFCYFYQGRKKLWLHPCAQATGFCSLMQCSD